MDSYNKVTWVAGFTTLFANFPLLIYSLYVSIFLREDLVTIIIIVTVIGALRNLIQIFLRIPLGELSQIIGRKPLIIGAIQDATAWFCLTDKICKSFFKILIGTVVIQVLVINVSDERIIRMVTKKCPVALIGLGHEISARPKFDILPAFTKNTAHHRRRPQSRRNQEFCGQR